ncbi:unnamed protein product [Rhizophagus irregularis]|nr:unnamed protein product [Rhizophagus irregularis]
MTKFSCKLLAKAVIILVKISIMRAKVAYFRGLFNFGMDIILNIFEAFKFILYANRSRISLGTKYSSQMMYQFRLSI